MMTKILALTDALGNLVRFILLPGHRFDNVGVPPLIDGLSLEALIADRAFDSNTIIAKLNERGAKIVISQHQRPTQKRPFDAEIYKYRHLIENFFCILKEFKSIALRTDKADETFDAILHVAAAVVNSRRISKEFSLGRGDNTQVMVVTLRLGTSMTIVNDASSNNLRQGLFQGTSSYQTLSGSSGYALGATKRLEISMTVGWDVTIAPGGSMLL